MGTLSTDTMTKTNISSFNKNNPRKDNSDTQSTNSNRGSIRGLASLFKSVKSKK